VSDDSSVVYVMVVPELDGVPDEIDEMTGEVVSATGIVSEQDAVVPPFEPTHCQRY
jgi:hypothetical protein